MRHAHYKYLFPILIFNLMCLLCCSDSPTDAGNDNAFKIAFKPGMKNYKRVQVQVVDTTHTRVITTLFDTSVVADTLSISTDTLPNRYDLIIRGYSHQDEIQYYAIFPFSGNQNLSHKNFDVLANKHSGLSPELIPSESSYYEGDTAVFTLTRKLKPDEIIQWYVNQKYIPWHQDTILSLDGLTMGQSGDTVKCRILNHSGYEACKPFTIVVNGRWLNPKGPPSMPVGVVAAYDSVTKKVTVRWDSVQVPDFSHYEVFRLESGEDASEILVSIEPSSIPMFSDSAFTRQETSIAIYQYRIRAVDTSGEMSPKSLPAFARVHLSSKLRLLAPIAESVGLPLSIRLSWLLVSNEVSPVMYQVRLDTQAPPQVILSDGRTNPGLELTNLISGMRYYWQVLAMNETDTLFSPIQWFITAPSPPENSVPDMPSGPQPDSGATGVSVTDTEIRWKAGDGNETDTLRYDVYIGETRETLQKISTALSVSRLVLPPLPHGQTVYWRITVSDGKTTQTGPIWQFLTRNNEGANLPPQKPTSPFPGDRLDDVTKTVQLSWHCTDSDESDTVVSGLYFDDQVPPERLVAPNLKESTYEMTDLASTTVYYWKIVCSDGSATESGDIWRFTTGPKPKRNHPPAAPNPILPNPGGMVEAPSTELIWLGDDEDKHDTLHFAVYLDTIHPPQILVANLKNERSYMADGLVAQKKYYWKIVATDGKSETSSIVTEFDTK